MSVLLNAFSTRQDQVEETLKRIEANKYVIGTIVVNAEGELKAVSCTFTLPFYCKCFKSVVFPGIPIRTTLDNSTTVVYAQLLRHLTMKARNTVRDLDPQNDICFLRMQTKKHNILVAPGECPEGAFVLLT